MSTHERSTHCTKWNLSWNRKGTIGLIFMLCQVFKSSGCCPAQSSVTAVVCWLYLVGGQVEGRDRAFARVMKYDGFHCLFLISSLSGAKII